MRWNLSAPIRGRARPVASTENDRATGFDGRPSGSLHDIGRPACEHRADRLCRRLVRSNGSDAARRPPTRRHCREVPATASPPAALPRKSTAAADEPGQSPPAMPGSASHTGLAELARSPPPPDHGYTGRLHLRGLRPMDNCKRCERSRQRLALPRTQTTLRRGGQWMCCFASEFRRT